MTDALDPTLEHWLDRFRGPLVGLLASWGANWAEAEELAMDTFADAWLGRSRLRGDPRDSAVVGPWLRGVARHLLLARQRQRQRQRLESLPADLPAPTAVPDERLEVLRAAFALLPPEMQTVLRMYYLDDTTTHEVAVLLDLTDKAVENRLYAARRALRAHAERLQNAAAGAER